MGPMKTPGVYVVERNAFPNSVVEVATAVPAFIGHTAKADKQGRSLAGTPWRISSMAEYQQFFGFAPTPLFELTHAEGPSADAPFQIGGKGYRLTQPDGPAGGRYLLVRALQHFFHNGGGPCYIVSVGNYDRAVTGDALRAGIESLVAEQEPTLVLIPEAVLLAQPDCIAVQQAMLEHCGGRMKNRIALLDIRDGWKSEQDSHCISRFRDTLGTAHLDFGAAYHPWLNTDLVQDEELGLANLSPASRDLLAHEPSATGLLFEALRAEMKKQLNLLPPSAALAGVYTMVDNTRGVWKAPANVSLNRVVSPAVNLSHEEQAELNVTPQGKSINAIRSFIGEGVLVWGARTLDGNSLDWRYVNVRRTMIMLEESCRLAVRALVFEPNVAGTWVAVKSMIRNFLTGIWKRGGLAGAVPDDAFSVHIGLGETMTAEDVLEGVLRVTVLVAVVRPAEFTEITFEQRMQAP